VKLNHFANRKRDARRARLAGRVSRPADHLNVCAQCGALLPYLEQVLASRLVELTAALSHGHRVRLELLADELRFQVE
jgi:hypothetical protein